MSAAQAPRLDWRQVRALLRAYLYMSVRKMPLRTMRGERKGGGMGPLVFLVVIYGFLGLLLAGIWAITKDLFLGAFAIHLMTFFVVGTAAMSEASDVLFNSSENEVLGHKPIQPVTLVVAKALTILVFTLLIASAINFAPTVALAFMDGARPIAPLVHAGSVLLSNLFASAAVVCIYGLVARLLGRERLQRVVTWAQIGSTVFLAAGFQLVPRILNARGGFDLSGLLHGSWLVWLVPPAWFAGIDAWLGARTSDPRCAELALLGIGATAFVSWLGLLRLPSTGTNVATLQEESRPERPREPAAVAARGSGIERLLAPWLRDPVERASFRLARAYLLRERSVKVRLAAALGFYVVFPVLAILDRERSSFLPLMMLWMTALVPMTVLEVLRISSNPAAADLFLYAPIEGGARVFHGVRKAAIATVQLPLLVYLLAITAYVLHDDPQRMWIALPPLCALPTLSLLPGISGEYLPLSAAGRTGQRSLQTLLSFLVLIPAALLGGLSYLAQRNGLLWLMLVLELPVVVLLHTLLLRVVASRSRRPGSRWGRSYAPGKGA